MNGTVYASTKRNVFASLLFVYLVGMELLEVVFPP